MISDVRILDLYPPGPTVACPSCKREIPPDALLVIEGTLPCGCVVGPPRVETFSVASHCPACGDEPALDEPGNASVAAGETCRHRLCPGGTYAPYQPPRYACRARNPDSRPSAPRWLVGPTSEAVRALHGTQIARGAARQAALELRGWELYQAALQRAQELGGESLAGWEVVCRWRNWMCRDAGAAEPPPVVARILSDVQDLLPEAIARWQHGDAPDPDPRRECRTLVVEARGPDGAPVLRIVYETIGTPGSTGARIARALDPVGRWTFCGLRPPSEDYWRGLPVPGPGRPAGEPGGSDGRT